MTDVVNPKRASPDQLLPYHKKISAEGKALMICFISYTYMVLKRTERLRKYLSNRKNISVFRSVLPSRVRADHRVSSPRHGYGTVERFKQILHHHGHGRHRDQYQPGHPRKNRNETDSSGPVLLDRNFPGQPVHAEFSGHLVSGS